MKRIFSILLVAIMLFSTLAIGTQAQTITTESSQNKLTDGLKSYLETVENDEYVPIYIWLNEQDEEMVYAVLSKTLGMTVTKNSEEAYIERKASAKAELLSKGLENLAKTPEYSLQARATGTIDIVNLTPDVFRAQANIPEIMTNDEIKNCIESGMTSDEIINLSERTQFLSDFRMARKSLNNATNEQFYKLLDLDKCKNVYLDPLLAYVRMDCKKSYVDNLENMDVVREIGHHIETQFSIDNGFDSEENETYGAYHMLQNDYNLPNSGTGIKIGVIEAVYKNNIPYRYYDTSNPHLLGKQINFRASLSEQPTYAISTHATKVLSILCGNPIPSNTGEIYQGIAPYATVSLTNIVGSGEFSEAMEWLIITENVSVINYSGGSTSNSGIYLDYSETLDEYVFQYRVTYVNAAGNDYSSKNVINPALAYNAIAVGNAAYDTTNEEYVMHNSSCYNEQTNLSNKPDVSAIGTNVYMLSGNETVTNLGYGTSFSAPMVAGTVALMMQANPKLIGKPSAVKAILMNSADEEAIYYNDTEGALENELVSSIPTVLNTNKISLDSTVLREKSGAGLLNIPASIRMAQSDLFYYIDFDYSPEGFVSQKYRFNAGTTVEFGVVSEKIMYSEEEEEEGLDFVTGYDFELQIIDSTGQIIFKSTDMINNAKLYKCTFDVTGNYTFRIVASSELEYLGMTSATFILSCGCSEKVLSQGNCIVDKHTISCANAECEFSINEYHDTTQITKSLSNGMSITLTVYYCPQKLVEVPTTSFEYYTIDVVVNVPNGYTCHRVDSAGYNVTQTWTGEIRTHTFEAIIEAPNANGMVDFITFPSITITIDYYEQTVTLS